MASSYVGKPCPKCAHVRTAADAGPDWQCPKCGIAYAKFQAAEPGAGPQPRAAPAAAGMAARPADESYTLAALAHFLVLLGLFLPLISIVVPIIIWKTRDNEDDMAASAAKEAINFQLSFLLWLLALGAGAIASMFLPMLIWVVGGLFIALWIGAFILPIVAGFKTLGGTRYTYPFIKHFFD